MNNNFKYMEKYSEAFYNFSPPDLYFSEDGQYAVQMGDPKKHILSMKNTVIKEVWEHNMEEELFKIMELIETYNVIAMDTEFPGVTMSPQQWNDDKDFEYQLVKDNVAKLKLIQIGISLSNEQGEVPEENMTWQFNFKFDLAKDEKLNDAITLLKNSGINFDTLKNKGIEHDLFAEFLIASGVVLNEDIKWISFHGGFDFAYLLKMLKCEDLPLTEKQFYKELNLYFPRLYDIKYLIKDIEHIKDDGLSKLASDISVERIGPQHQAGSDSLVTLAAFFKLKESYLKNDPSIFEKGENIIYGIGPGFVESKEYHNNYKYQNNNAFMEYPNDPSSFYNYYVMNPTFYNQQTNYNQTDSFFRPGSTGSSFNYSNFMNNPQYGFNLNSGQEIANNNNGANVLYKNNNKSNKNRIEKIL